MTNTSGIEQGAVDKWCEVLRNAAYARAARIGPNPYALSKFERFGRIRDYYLTRLASALLAFVERRNPALSWYQACDLLALTSGARAGDAAALQFLCSALDRQMTSDGSWRYPITSTYQLMQGYSVAFAFRRTREMRYQRALSEMAEAAEHLPRSSTGTIVYTKGYRAIFVDQIGMMCPFLTSAGVLLQRPELIEMAERQIEECIRHNLHAETRLPYHGYYAGGPYCLGWAGWGRGVGWYLMGLMNVAAELRDVRHPLVDALRSEIPLVVNSVCRFQRTNGHWGEQVMVDDASDDSSATAFLTYALLFGVNEGLLRSETCRPTIERAVAALAACTNRQGQIEKASSEALSMGQYGRTFQFQPWADGLAAAVSFELRRSSLTSPHV